MYLILRVANKAISGSGLLGLEFSSAVPNYVTSDSDLVYINLSSMTDSDKAKVTQIVNNIDTTTLQVAAMGIYTTTLAKVTVTGTNTSRKLPEGSWNDVIQPAWYRLANATTFTNM